MSSEMTEQEREIMEVIIGAISKRGMPPQSRQIAHRLDIPESTVRKRLCSLCVKGYIKHIRYAPNGIRLLRDMEGDPVNIVVKIEKVTG